MPMHARHHTSTETIQAQAKERQKEADAAAAERQAALDALAAMVDEPPKVWQAAVELVQRYAAVAGAYLAQIVEEEEPDWMPGEEEEQQVG